MHEDARLVVQAPCLRTRAASLLDTRQAARRVVFCQVSATRFTSPRSSIHSRCRCFFFPSFARCQCNQSPGLDIPFAESQVPSFAAPPPKTKYCHPKELSFRILAISTARQSKTRACAGSALGPVGSVDSKWAAISRAGFGLRRLHFTRSCTSFRVHFLLPGTTRPPCIRVVSCYLRSSCP